MSTFIMALMSSKNVQYHSIAACISGEALEGSKVRRTQRFMSEFDLYFYSVADFLLNLLPKKGKITFCLDRTEWQFGEFTHNMLVLTAYSHRVGIPIWFEPVNENGGCSDVNDRIYTILCCLQLVEKERINCLIADSEFIGQEWIDFLIKEDITFYIDIRSNQHFIYENKEHTVESFMRGKYKTELKQVHIYNQCLNIGIKRQKQTGTKKRKPFLSVITNAKKSVILNIYRNRWSIEVCFQSFKERGFEIEKTHLQDAVRMRKLFALISMAFVVAFRAGLEVNKHTPIPIKNHDGYKENSFFRKGRDFLRNLDASRGKSKKIKERKIKEFEIIFQSLCEIILKVFKI